jgi:hypothetical protein
MNHSSEKPETGQKKKPAIRPLKITGKKAGITLTKP